MAIVNGYVGVDELREYMRNQAMQFEGSRVVERAIETSARDVDAICRRRFWKDTTATDRVFYPDQEQSQSTTVDDRHFSLLGQGRWTAWAYRLRIDDCWDLESLTIDGVAIDLDDYDLQPLNGVRDGIEGWPVTGVAVRRDSAAVKVFTGRCVATGKWGWENVPSPVKTANLLLAAEKLKAGEVPFGVAAAGDTAMRLGRINPLVLAELETYQNRRRRVASVRLT